MTTKVNDRIKTLTARIDEKRPQAQEAWARFEAAREKAASTDDGALLAPAEKAHQEYQQIAGELDKLEEQRQSFWRMDGRADADGPSFSKQSPLDGDSKAQGWWLSKVIELHTASPLSTDDIGSKDTTDRIFFDRLYENSAILSTPGLTTETITTTSVEVGTVNGRMAPAVPVAELDPIPKDDVPIVDTEIKPPKFPKLVTLSLEAYRDARPIRLAAVEAEMIRAIATGFDLAAFHGGTGTAQVGLEHTPGVNTVPLDTPGGLGLESFDWVADALGSLLDKSARPGVLYLNPYTVANVLQMKDSTGRLLVTSLQDAASDLLGVPVRVTNSVHYGQAFMLDPRVLVVIRRQDIETRVFEDYGFDNAEVGLRAIARMALHVAQPDGVTHITGLPVPE